MQELQTDIVIIGAGPVGLFAVFEAGMLKMRAHVIDALDIAGGQCAALYPEKPIYDIPGYPSILAGELVEKLKAQAEPFEPVYHLGQRVESVTGHWNSGNQNIPITNKSSNYQITTSAGTVITCKAIIIAAGCGAFGPNRPPLEGLEQYEGKSVFYLVKKREDFRGKRIVIAGGGDSAVDWAISLADLAEKLYVIHRRPKFRCAPESAARLQALADAGKIELVIPYQLARLEGSNGRLSSVVVSTLEGEEKTLEADVLLPFFGLAMELGPIAEWGLNLTQNHIAVTPATMQTSTPGIFAIGDIASYEGKLKLILSGFAEAAAAAHAAYAIVHPGEALHFEYSTTSGVPKAAA
ncbi:MAG: NAD(P)/FAD-dependent oxidoreductase [Pseudomonadota bacterium]|nr:NAD(P)/FAD-dependent oxidoreductase [Pseudomonadota bacterium]